MYLLIQPSGSKLWRYRYRIGGKQKQYAIGVYDDVSLVDARAERKKARDLVRQGIDPVHQRSTEKIRLKFEQANTFKSLARAWIDKKRINRSADYSAQIENTFSKHIYPTIGDRPIGSLTAIDMLDVLEKMQACAPTLAHMTRQWMSGVFEFAIVRRLIEYDPARMVRGGFQRPPPKKKQPLTPLELPGFLTKLDQYASRPQAQVTTVIAIRLLLLTFVRTGELRKAKWSEIDRAGGLWRIPAEHMKKRREHLVPLSNQALKSLHDLHIITGHQALLFPNLRTPKEPMNKGTVNAALRFMGYNGRLSAHAFRNTASTLLHEMGYQSDHIEMQLAHFDGTVRGRYNSAKYLEARRSLMQDWADYIDSLQVSVTCSA